MCLKLGIPFGRLGILLALEKEIYSSSPYHICVSVLKEGSLAVIIISILSIEVSTVGLVEIPLDPAIVICC